MMGAKVDHHWLSTRFKLRHDGQNYLELMQS